VNGNNQISFRWTREAIITERDSIEGDLAVIEAARHENDSGDQVFSASWTSVVNNRMTNELKFGHVRENLLQGPGQLFDDNWNFIGFAGIDPFDVGSRNSHPDYNAGVWNSYAQDLIRDITFDDTVTWVKNGWGGDHTFKAGVAYSRNGALPQGTATNFTGLFTFPTDAPFNAADPRTYPFRFGISMGQYDFTQIDHRYSGYVQDKWQVNDRLTLNLGVRYDYQNLTENTKDAIGGDGITQFGRALATLNIDILCANTPQAKGRVERAFGTLQDRLVKELRLAEISTMEAANAWELRSPLILSLRIQCISLAWLKQKYT